MKAVRPIASRRSDERGFALLLVFLLAAAVALMLYQQMPRVAFESQREKEQLLIGRGEQYKRAIQMYFVAFKKYPSKIEDLENTNNQRFLRRRYIDPMTGKDEWRLIHVNAAGQLTDSQVQKPPSPDDKSNPQNASGPNAPGTLTTTGATNPATPAATSTTGANGNGNPNGTPAVNAAVLRRPSDRPLTPTPGTAQNAPTSDPNDPRNWPPIFLQPAAGTPGAGQPGVPPVPGQQPGQAYPGQQYNPGLQNNLGQPGQQYNPGQPYNPSQNPVGVQPGSFQPGLPGQIQVPGQTLPGQNPPNYGQTNPINPNQVTPIASVPGYIPGTGAPPPIPGGGSNPAVGMINDMLRQPRQADGSSRQLHAGRWRTRGCRQQLQGSQYQGLQGSAEV